MSSLLSSFCLMQFWMLNGMMMTTFSYITKIINFNFWVTLLSTAGGIGGASKIAESHGSKLSLLCIHTTSFPVQFTCSLLRFFGMVLLAIHIKEWGPHAGEQFQRWIKAIVLEDEVISNIPSRARQGRRL